ncbi:MAG: hypothetical protein OXK79_10315 [Chloroflexota bacterium]|nr:hypothetical protein [Chloroflexota bacterium]
MVQTVGDSISGVADAVSCGAKRALDSTAGVARRARKRASSLKDLIAVAEGTLASDISRDLDKMLSHLAIGPATIYDKAMDASYLATNVGGANHRLFDGGHTIAGALDAVRGASKDDNIVQEALGFVQGMFRDLTTSKGLPLANWDKATYDQAASFLESKFRIARDWFSDLNSYTSAELISGCIGILALVFQWKQADTESFSRFVGGIGVAACISANPLLLVVTLVALARAFQMSRPTAQYHDLVDGSARGAIVSTLTILAILAITQVGGPVAVSLLVGIVVGLLASKALSHISVVEISRFLVEWAKAAADDFAVQPVRERLRRAFVMGHSQP